MKRLLIFLPLLLFATAVRAQETVMDYGLKYDISPTNHTASVTGQRMNIPSNVLLPTSITYNGTKYTIISIGDGAFSDSSTIKSITIPNSVKSIGKSAFTGCKELMRVVIPFSISNIADSAFYNCEELKELYAIRSKPIDYHCSASAFGESAAKCTLHIPAGSANAYRSTTPWNSFTHIIEHDNLAFRNDALYFDATVDGLTYSINHIAQTASLIQQVPSTISGSITIPSTIAYGGTTYSVTSIVKNAFSDCSDLTGITIPNSITNIEDHTFYWCDKLVNISIGDSVKSIGNGVFDHCTGLTSITIPNSVTTIGNGAFYYCTELTSIIIPNSVVSIGREAFFDCVNIEEIYAPRTEPQDYRCDIDAFNNIPENCTLHVPVGCVNKYRHIAPWNKFKHIREEQNFLDSWQKVKLRQSW